MPITENGTGYSNESRIKQQIFRKIVRAHLRTISRRIYRAGTFTNLPSTYYYLDLFAGPGETAEYGDGSPVIFLTEAAWAQCPTKAYFFEKNPQSCGNLARMVNGENNVHVIWGDCQNWSIQSILPLEQSWTAEGNCIERERTGLVYVDPCGLPPWEYLGKSFKHDPRDTLDILLHVPATAIKRCAIANNTPRLSHMLSWIGMENWLISEPIGCWQWVFIFGTDQGVQRYGPLLDLGLRPINVPEGLGRLRKANYTREELNALPQLPGIPENTRIQAHTSSCHATISQCM